MKIVVFSY